MFKLLTTSHLQDGSDTVCHGVDTLDSETQEVVMSSAPYLFLVSSSCISQIFHSSKDLICLIHLTIGS